MRDHDVPFPFNVRRTLGGWKFLFLDGKPFQPDPSKSAQWNRGAYLVNGPGHCAECHSPRNLLGGIVAAQRFAGGPNPEGEGWVPNITQKGLAIIPSKDIAYLLETGNTPDGDSVGGAMIAGHPQHLAALAGGPRRDGGLHQVAAAGRRAEEAGEEIGSRLPHRACADRRACDSMPRAFESTGTDSAMNILKAVLLKLISALLFAVMSALVRYVSDVTPLGQMVFFRSAFAIIPVVVIYAWRRELDDRGAHLAPVRPSRPRR